MSKRSFLAAALTVVVVAATGAGSAFAGEVTGNGKDTPIGLGTFADPHAHSICSFSGQNDGNPPPGRTADTQNWGQLTKEQQALQSPPGESCNGHTGVFAG
jgi:hypothetical protein